jgi:hypothetical protein
MRTPEEKHILRQVYWLKELPKRGYSNVHLEKTVNIGRNKSLRTPNTTEKAKHGVQVDVYGEKNGKSLIIEIGEMMNGRKRGVLKRLAKSGHIRFIWEYKGFESECQNRKRQKRTAETNRFEIADVGEP